MNRKIKMLCVHCYKGEATIFRAYPTDDNDILDLCLPCSQKKICIYCEAQPIPSNKGDLCHACYMYMEADEIKKWKVKYVDFFTDKKTGEIVWYVADWRSKERIINNLKELSRY